MTTNDQNQADDKAFDEFLEGRGELVKRIQALSQLTPSAALDAAILASAKSALAQGKAVRNAAANDASLPRELGSAPPSFFSRLRMPLALAASLVVAVLVVLQWQVDPDRQEPLQVAQASAPADVQIASDAGPAVEATAKTATVAPQVAAATPPASVATGTKPLARQKVIPPQVAANNTTKPGAAATPPMQVAQADTSRSEQKSIAAQRMYSQKSVATSSGAPAVAGNLATESAKADAAAEPATRALAADQRTHAESSDKAKVWIAHIEELMRADSNAEALAEWAKFQKAYPDYPVGDKFKTQIQALKQ